MQRYSVDNVKILELKYTYTSTGPKGVKRAMVNTDTKSSKKLRASSKSVENDAIETSSDSENTGANDRYHKERLRLHNIVEVKNDLCDNLFV